MTLRLSRHLKPNTSTDHLRNDLDLGISLKSVGISQCFKEAIVTILGQVRVILVMGISPQIIGDFSVFQRSDL